jgi:hypothetical protein
MECTEPGCKYMKMTVPYKMETVVRLDAQVEKAFFCPSAEYILRIATKINKYENKITKIVKNTSNPANVKSTISFVLISEQEIANSGEMSQKK